MLQEVEWNAGNGSWILTEPDGPMYFCQAQQSRQVEFAVFMHVNKSVIGGRKWKIEQFFRQFVKYLKIKRLKWLKNHLGAWWHWKEDPEIREIYLKVPKMVQEIKEVHANAMEQPA